MSTNSYMLKVGLVEALIVRKAIKNVHLSVLPPEGKVRVTAPVAMNDDAIRILLATRLGWINRQQTKFRNQQRQTPREYVSGESHYLFGRRYRLEVRYEEAPPRVEAKANGKLFLYVRPNASQGKRHEVITEWYRTELHQLLEDLIPRWQDKIGVRPSVWAIKRMRTRWGTCNKDKKRILLNLELVKKPVSCIEYVVVHELIHLIEKKHNNRFVQLLTRHLPKWKSQKQELNRFILSHEEWRY
ncbi:MAG: M48 family metallopeptidase [Candidatus Kerfeldbacteria bacterium]|nr:M48 family metallopeptidase [Candidatus Kerfeldbacteria bacterium]